MSQRIIVKTSVHTEPVVQEAPTPFDTGERTLELSNFHTHEQSSGYRDIGASLRVSGLRVNVGGERKYFDFNDAEMYRFKVDPTSANRIFKLEAVQGSRMAITLDGVYPVRTQLDGIYNTETGQLMIMVVVVNNNTDKVITVDKIIISYKE